MKERTNEARTKVVGYCRVSTENQREEGTIEIQKQSLEEYAESNGFDLVECFTDDGVSGGLENRPGLADLFDFLEANSDIDGVVIYKLDRIARDLYIQETVIKKLEELKVKLISILEPDLDSKDPMRKAFRQFMGIVSELEKAFITMRMSGGRINKARKGGYAGGRIALGYALENGDLVRDEENAETVRTVFGLKDEGFSLRAIARILNGRGIRTARGGKWYASTVRYILENPIYKGFLTYRDERVERSELAIV